MARDICDLVLKYYVPKISYSKTSDKNNNFYIIMFLALIDYYYLFMLFIGPNNVEHVLVILN